MAEGPAAVLFEHPEETLVRRTGGAGPALSGQAMLIATKRTLGEQIGCQGGGSRPARTGLDEFELQMPRLLPLEAPPMRTYPVDLDPEQVVRWIQAEYKAAPSMFRITARRTNEVREIPDRKEIHLGDEEREDLSEIATVTTLEIAPAHVSEGWLLTVTVEDEADPRLSESGATGGEERIDLDTFYREFIRPGRGNASVIAEAEDRKAEVRMASLFESIERNRHSPGTISPKHKASQRAEKG